MLLLDDLSLYRNGIPHALYDEVRRQGAVYFNDGLHPFYAVMRHKEATTVLQDTAGYSSALRGIQIEDVSAQMTPVMRAMLPYLDPPDHTMLRQTLFPPLMPRQLGRFKERLEAACQSLVDQAARERDIDFVTRLAAQVPLTAFGLLMGLEPGELEPLRGPSDAIIEYGINNCAAEVAQLCASLEDLVAVRVREPRDDYMTLLARVEFPDRPIGVLERNGMLLQIVIGGLETTRSAMAGFLVALSETRSQWELMRATPGVIANAVEESLRFVTPVNYLRRTTSAALHLAGVMLPAGARVVVFLGSANRDPARFVEPHKLDIERKNARHHVALGAGSHFCMGAGLARLQLIAFWTAFASGIANFELLGPYERFPALQQNLLKRMPIRLTLA